MTLLTRINALLDATTQPLVASAHCDLPCGVYDPAQARIEAQSVKGCMEKYNASSDDDFKVRATFIKRSVRLVKHHLWVLWTDYFKVEHLKEYRTCTTSFGWRPRAPARRRRRMTSRRRSAAERDRRHRRNLLGHQEVIALTKNPGGLGHRDFLFQSSSEFGVGRTVRE